MYSKILLCLVLAILIGQPILAQAHDKDKMSDKWLADKADGKRDAFASVDWYYAGFCGLGVGLLIAYKHKPTRNFLGGSGDYVEGYIQGYRDECAIQQEKKALYDMGAAFVLYGATYLILSGT